MSSGTNQVTTQDLWLDGRKATVSTSYVNPTTINVTWTLPQSPAVDGAVVLISDKPFTADQRPTNGQRYTPSSNFAAPVDNINGARVIAAFYPVLGQTPLYSINVSNVNAANTVYYASIHASSKVLQYYPLGVQSYPLEQSNAAHSSSATGSIPRASTPPSAPSDGQIYYDTDGEKLLKYNQALDAWVDLPKTTWFAGPRPPIEPLMCFYNTSTRSLRAFIDGVWYDCNSTNTQIKSGTGWIPLGFVHDDIVGYLPKTGPAWAPGSSIAAGEIRVAIANDTGLLTAWESKNSRVTGTTFNTTEQEQWISYGRPAAVGDIVLSKNRSAVAGPTGSSLKVFVLGQWMELSSSLIRFDTNGLGNWQNLKFGLHRSGYFDPEVPNNEHFYYDTTSGMLFTWTTQGWKQANTADEGISMSDKVEIGLDAKMSIARQKFTDGLKRDLGWPHVCVELNEEDFERATELSVSELRRRVSSAYRQRFLPYIINRGQNVYYLNDPRDDTDAIVDIIKIHRVNMFGASNISGDHDPFAYAFFNQLHSGGMLDLTAVHLFHQMAAQHRNIFVGEMQFTWNEETREMNILRKVSHRERVLLEVSAEKTVEEIINGRWTKNWARDWAKAELKEMLGQARSKYSSGLPGPSGTVTLNGQELISQSQEMKTELLRQIADYEVGNGGVDWQNVAFMRG